MTDSVTIAYREIKQNIVGRSTQEIHAWLTSQEMGVGGLLEFVFAQFPGAFLPERAKGQEVSFQYELETPIGHQSYFAKVENHRCTSGRGKIPSPSVTMAMDVSVFLQVLVGDMLPVRAFLTRKIKVTGDMMSATKFESWFSRPAGV